MKPYHYVAIAVSLFLFTVFLPGTTAVPNTSAACSPLPTDRGTATTTVNIPASGTYRVWSHISAPTSTDNSFYLQIDDTYCSIVVGDATIPTNTYTWVDYQSGNTSNKINVTLSAGSHTVIVAGREDEVRLNKIMFVSDMSCIPIGDGSNCTDSASTSPPPPTGTVSFVGVSTGQTVSGLVSVEARVDNLSGVTKVEFFVDGKFDRYEVNPPYCLAVSPHPTECSGWDSSKVANGSHTIKAKAHHTGGVTESSVTFAVQNESSSPPPDDTEEPVNEVVIPIDDSNNNPEPAPVAGRVVLQPSKIETDTEWVEYYVNGVPVEDGVLDTTSLPDGEHKVEVRQHKKGGGFKSSTSKILVDNDQTTLERIIATASANPVRSGGAAVLLVAVVGTLSYLYIHRYPVRPSLRHRIHDRLHGQSYPKTQSPPAPASPSTPSNVTPVAPASNEPTIVHPESQSLNEAEGTNNGSER